MQSMNLHFQTENTIDVVSYDVYLKSFTISQYIQGVSKRVILFVSYKKGFNMARSKTQKPRKIRNPRNQNFRVFDLRVT